MTKLTVGVHKHSSLLVAVLAGLPMVSLLGWTAQASAQYRIGSDGHQNDANPQVGSGGYNGATNNRVGNGAINNDIITGQVGGLNYFHARNNREINPNVVDTNTGTYASDRLNAIAGGTYGNTGTHVEAPIGTSPGVTPFYSTQSFLGTPPAGIALTTTANNTGLIAAPVIKPLTPDYDSRDEEANNLNVSPAYGNLQNPGGIDVLGGPVDPSGSATLLTMSPLYGVRGMQSGNAEDSFYQAKYGQTQGTSPGLQTGATPGATPAGPGTVPGTSPSTVQQMRDELNSTGQEQSPQQPDMISKPVSGAVSLGQSSLTNEVGNTAALPGASLNTNLSSQAVGGGVTSGQGMQEDVLVPAAKQTPQLKALQQKYSDNKKLTDVQAAARYNQEKHILDSGNAASGGAKPDTTDQSPTNPMKTGMGNPTPGMKPDEKTPSEAPGKMLENTPTINNKNEVITSLATGIPAKGLADLMKTAEDRMRQGKFTEAVDAYETAQKVAPNNPFIYLGRSFAELGSSYYGKADMDLRRAVLIDPAVLMGRYDLNGFLGQDRVSFIEKELTDIEGRETKSGRAPMLLAFVAHNVGDDNGTVTELNVASGKGAMYAAMVQEMRAAWNIKAPAPEVTPK